MFLGKAFDEGNSSAQVAPRHAREKVVHGLKLESAVEPV